MAAAAAAAGTPGAFSGINTTTLQGGAARIAGLFGGGRDITVAAGVIVVVMMFIIPMPTPLLDAFMALNLILSLLILLIVLYTKRPVDFSIFPTILLVVTLFGLALNVSSTKLILSQGAAFNGRMIRAFSSFVVGTSGTEGIVVGLVIFIVIIAVQVGVITKGSTRIAEVAARFALDSMQNKYLAIDTEFNSGAITEEEATSRRTAVRMEIDFYGAMDGASKFISGNVKVGIFITVVNIVGGVIIGAAIHGEALGQAVSTYIAFSIGDGLMSQLPALLVSTAVGMMVTRSVSSGTFAEDVGNQFTRQPPIYWVCAAVLFVMGWFPGFPKPVLWTLAAVMGFFAYRLTRDARRKQTAPAAAETDAKKEGDAEALPPTLPLDTLSLELGYGLIPLVDKDRGAELLERIQRLRRETATDLGLVIPKVRIIDNLRLDSSEYCFKIKGDEVGRGKIRMNHYLCINPDGASSGGIKTNIPGERTRDPAFGMPAIWVDEEHRDEAERAGYTVIDPPSIIATHLTELVKQNAASLLGRQETQAILDTLKKDFPAVVDEALKVLSLGEIEKVLQGLLREQVSIRNMVSILEAISDFAPAAKSITYPELKAQYLIENARQALGRLICLQYADEDKTLHVLKIEPGLEQKIVETGTQTPTGTVSAMDGQLRAAWLGALSRSIAAIKDHGWASPPVVLCLPQSRFLVKKSTEREFPELAAISALEVTQDVNVITVGEVRLENAGT
ncbi:MAG: flagellar biosynthesis protein FlhA [Spirochaetaceae bacterium]|jgi:flagellar biosynthesis protein FlhA|nr:flagellar biosynthesis protein FlhA [Spirochaetaceae bacterium]